jgi:hypothetical protein
MRLLLDKRRAWMVATDLNGSRGMERTEIEILAYVDSGIVYREPNGGIWKVPYGEAEDAGWKTLVMIDETP